MQNGLNGGGDQILGNLIGTRADGKTPLPNGFGIIDTQNGITNTNIGGTGAGQPNIIAFNNSAGVAVGGTGRGDRTVGNAIFSNGGLGIDLGPGGVTANDVGDGDTGGNELQNFPDPEYRRNRPRRASAGDRHGDRLRVDQPARFLREHFV